MREKQNNHRDNYRPQHSRHYRENRCHHDVRHHNNENDVIIVVIMTDGRE